MSRAALQRAVPVHRQFRAQHPGRSADQSLGPRQVRRLQRRQPPKGKVHPIALELLQHMKLPTEGLRSKSWDEFAAARRAALDFVFTVCDNAAGEVCPYWPGQPMTAHWGVEDPAAVEGSTPRNGWPFARLFASWRAASRSSRACRSARSTNQAAGTTRRDRQVPPTTKSPESCARRSPSSSARCCSPPPSSARASWRERLADGNAAVALLANTGATVAVLAALIAALRPDQRRAFQSCGHARGAFRGASLWREASVYHRRADRRAVAPAPCSPISCSSCRLSMCRRMCARASAMAGGIRRHGRPGAGRVHGAFDQGGRLARAGLDRRRLLVHRVDLVRESRRSRSAARCPTRSPGSGPPMFRVSSRRNWPVPSLAHCSCGCSLNGGSHD